MGNVVAVVVGVPGRIQTGARLLPGNLIARRRLLRTDRRPGAILPVHKSRTAILQRGAGSAAAIEVIFAADLNETCNTSRLDLLTWSWRERRGTNRAANRLRCGADVAGHIRGFGRQRVGTCRQGVSRDAPGSGRICRPRSDHRVPIVDCDRTVRLGGSG